MSQPEPTVTVALTVPQAQAALAAMQRGLHVVPFWSPAHRDLKAACHRLEDAVSVAIYLPPEEKAAGMPASGSGI